jgi:hypothetical protein
MTERTFDVVYPYDLFPKCPSCGIQRGISEKGAWKHCYGEPRAGQRTDDTCRFGPIPHIEVSCLFCGFVFAMETKDGEQALTAQEIRDLREVLAGLKVSPPEPSTKP